jgi:hypothetical protein
MTKEFRSSSRTFKSALIWSVPDGPKILSDEAQNLLSWRSLDNESELL